MGQCLKNRNCGKREGLENVVFTAWGSLALLDPKEHGDPHGGGTGAPSKPRGSVEELALLVLSCPSIGVLGL